MGKKNKLRTCPALGREISSAECGAGRHATIHCPPGCRHDIFAAENYDLLLEAETRLDKLTSQALDASIGSSRVLHIIDHAKAKGGEQAVNAAMIREIFFKCDASGHTFAERWLAQGTPGLDKDERVFFTGKARMRIAFFEVLEVRADGLIRVIDLLAPDSGEILLLDRRGWARATRFQILLVWAYPLPHYWRMCGGGVIWPGWDGCPLSPTEALGEIISHAGGPSPTSPRAEQRAWLAAHFEKMPHLVRAVSDARQRDMLSALDAMSIWSEYILTKPENNDLKTRLKAGAEVYPNDLSEQDEKAGFTTAYDVCLPPEPGEPADRREVLGRVLNHGQTWRIEALGRARLARLKTRFFELAALPPREPAQELAQDLGRQMSENIQEPDEATVPPRLRQTPQEIELKSYRLLPPETQDQDNSPTGITQRTLTQASQNWIDTPVPALDNLTPRVAVAHSPELRAKVVALVKSQIHSHDEARLRGKFLADTQFQVRALGLTELDVPAPPDRPCPPELQEEADSDLDEIATLTGPRLAPLPPRPLTEKEAIARLMQVKNHYTDEDDLLDHWSDACPDWSRAVFEWGELHLEDAELDNLELGLALAWAMLGGADNPSATANLNGTNLRAACDHAWLQLSLAPSEKIGPLLDALNPHQHPLQRVLLVYLVSEAEKSNRDPAEEADLYIALSVWLDAVVPELTCAK